MAEGHAGRVGKSDADPRWPRAERLRRPGRHRRYLSSSDQNQVFWVAVALGRLEAKAREALGALIRVSATHPRFGVRQAALRALPRIAPSDPEVKAALKYALGDESHWVRLYALQSLIDVPELDASDLAAIAALERDAEPMVVDQVEVTLRNIRLRE